MMDEQSPGDVCDIPQEVEVHEDNASPLEVEFWDIYEEHGMEHATNFFDTFTNGDVEEAKQLIPLILDEAKARGIDMVQFLVEWDKHAAAKQQEATNEQEVGE
jgi:hypothetical protein